MDEAFCCICIAMELIESIIDDDPHSHLLELELNKPVFNPKYSESEH